MTADERIERLLNRFGQTISDLLDRALQALVDMETDIPCDAMANADNF